MYQNCNVSEEMCIRDSCYTVVDQSGQQSIDLAGQFGLGGDLLIAIRENDLV